MKNKTISPLKTSEWRIIKNIQIISETKFGNTVIGNIIYKRLFSENYNLKKQKEEDDQNPNSRNENLIGEYPKQKNYPVDNIDNIILNSIKSIYPKSEVRNDLLLFNIDLENLKLLKNKKNIQSKLFFEPKLEDYSTEGLKKLIGQTFNLPIIEINVYTELNEFNQYQNFIIKYPINNKDVIENIKDIEFE